MKTSFLPPAKILFVNVTMAIVLLPCFAAFVAIVSLSGLADGLGSGGTAAWEQALLGVLVILVPLVALLMVLWKGWSRLPLVLLLLAFFALGIPQRTQPPVYRHIDLLIGQYSPTTGVDVFCNGVYLGQTPLSISRREFNEKVPPWTKPPHQDRLMIGTFPGQEWDSAKYAWVPSDILEQYDHWPPTYTSIQDNKGVRQMLKSARYWWHFETDGHQGICGTSNFGGGAHGSNSRLEVSASPQIQYPALEPHLALVIDGLNAGKGPPNAAWIAHFRKYENLLFLPFYEKARTDPWLRAALDAVVRAEFDMPQNPTPQDCERILAAVLDRVEARGCFQMPSPESMAIDLMGDAAKDSVVRHYWDESSDSFISSGQRGGGSGSPYTICYRNGNAVRQLPLEYAVKRLQPPELFDAIVYRWARTGQNLELVGCYQNPVATQLIIDYYVFDIGRQGDRYTTDRALGMAATIINPSVEEYLRNFARDNAAVSNHGMYAQHLVESRIGATGIDQDQLAAWVFHWAPLDDREKQRLLPRINSPSTATYMKISGIMDDPRKRQDAISQLAATPNPSLDRLLIDAYVSAKEPQYTAYGYGGAMILKALIRTDTPAIRKFIGEKWQNESDRALLLDNLTSQDKADLARQNWMMPLVAQLADAESQVKAARLLAAVHTPEAMKLLDKWSREGSADARRAVEQQYQEQRQQDAEQAHRLQQWSKLLAGKIQPEDLVPSQKPWDWNGKEYVQEK